MTFLILSFVACFGYIILVTYQYVNIPQSISNSYYMWLTKPKMKQWAVVLFYGWCILSALPLMVFWLDLSENIGNTELQWLIFIGCSSLVFTGVAYKHQDKGEEGKIHKWSAIICAVFSQIWLFIYDWKYIILAVFLFSLCFCLSKITKGQFFTYDGKIEKSKNILYWMEIASFSTVYISLLAIYLSLN